MSIKNSLTVLLSSSYQLGEICPIEIRDSHLNLVKQIRPGQRVDLDDGVYEISAVLEDGQKHLRFVQLQGGSKEDITLDAQEVIQTAPCPPLLPRMKYKLSAKLEHESFRFSTTRIASNMPLMPLNIGSERSSFSKHQDVPIEFVESHEAVLKEKRVTETGKISWVFEPFRNLVAVPHADFLIRGRKITISLPLNPGCFYPLDTSDVVVVMNSGAPELRAWISRERTVASAMQHMLASGYILHAARIASEARELLRDKYQDPTGALLGALLLHKIGKLESRRDWVENLAQDFVWLNDGKVLMSILLSRDDAQQDKALTLALRASERSMMFTESYSLLLNLLRRWKGTSRLVERQNALKSLAMMTPYTNWDSIMFYQMNPEEDSNAKTHDVACPTG